MKKLLLAFLLLLASSIALGDDITEFGELVSIELYGNGSDFGGLLGGRVTLRVDEVDTIYSFGGTFCNRSIGNTADLSALQNALLAPYMRVRFRTDPGNNVSDVCIVGIELTNEKFLVP